MTSGDTKQVVYLQQPSIGRVVHFVATNGAHVPADICGISGDEQNVHLFVKDPYIQAAYFEMNVSHDPMGSVVGTWHWPERV